MSPVPEPPRSCCSRPARNPGNSGRPHRHQTRPLRAPPSASKCPGRRRAQSPCRLLFRRHRAQRPPRSRRENRPWLLRCRGEETPGASSPPSWNRRRPPCRHHRKLDQRQGAPRTLQREHLLLAISTRQPPHHLQEQHHAAANPRCALVRCSLHGPAPARLRPRDRRQHRAHRRFGLAGQALRSRSPRVRPACLPLAGRSHLQPATRGRCLDPAGPRLPCPAGQAASRRSCSSSPLSLCRWRSPSRHSRSSSPPLHRRCRRIGTYRQRSACGCRPSTWKSRPPRPRCRACPCASSCCRACPFGCSSPWT